MTNRAASSLAASFLFLAATLPVLAAESAPGPATKPTLPTAGLIVDLNADKDVELDGDKIINWKNQTSFKAKEFKFTRPNGRPSLLKSVDALKGHNSIDFEKQELLNDDEDAFDYLTTGAGYTWFAIVALHQQVTMEKDVNAFFGNLKNGGNYEGFWGGVTDDNVFWAGPRNGITFGRWDKNNPHILGPKLEQNRFYVLAGRMGAGTEEVTVDLYVNDPKPVASSPIKVNTKANASKMAIGQERDATNHPGRESFKGEIARILFWDRPMTDAEVVASLESLKQEYGIK